MFVVWSGLGNRKIGTLLSIEDRRCLLVVRVGTWLELPLATTDTSMIEFFFGVSIDWGFELSMRRILGVCLVVRGPL